MTENGKSVRSVRLRILGHVQGVFYRAWTKEQADALGLSGWVRNLPDGSVEALFAGAPPLVEEMIARAGKGPPYARVESVKIVAEGEKAPPLFQVRS